MKIKRLSFTNVIRHGAKMLQSASIESAPQLGVVSFKSIELVDLMGFPCFVLTSAGSVTHHPFTAVTEFEVLPEEKAPLKK